MPSVLERVLSRIEIDSGSMLSDEPCWLFTGADNGRGYGQVWHERKQRFVHRVTYEHLVGAIPDGLTIDHLCRKRNCCNPSHLEIATGRENVLRGDAFSARNARKTHCPRGHELIEGNLAAYPMRKYGWRVCRTCHAARQRERRVQS